MTMVINFVAFQVGWLSAVTTAAKGVPLLGLLVMGAAVALHLARARRAGAELFLLFICAAIGAAWDSLLVAFGWVQYPSGNLLQGVAPYWIVGMWVLFATTLNVSMRWLRHRYLLAAVLGAGGGPLAYYTGERLGGIELTQFWQAMLALGTGWAVLMPILLWLSAQLDGVSEEVAPDTLAISDRAG